MPFFFGPKQRSSINPWVRRGVIGVLGIASLGAVAGGISGCSHGMRGGPGQVSEADAAKWRERGIERITKELALDDSQKQRLGKLADVMQAQRKALMGGANSREMAQTLVAGERFDRQAAQALVTTRMDAMRSASPELIAAFGDFYDGLRPDQQQKVRDFLAKRGRGGHRGMKG